MSSSPDVDPSAFERQLEERLRALAHQSTPIEAYIAPPTEDELESRYKKLMEKQKRGEGITEKELEERLGRLRGIGEKPVEEGELESRLAKLQGEQTEGSDKNTVNIAANKAKSVPVDEVDGLVQQVQEEVQLDGGVRDPLASPPAAVTASSTPNSNLISEPPSSSSSSSSSTSTSSSSSSSSDLVSAVSAAVAPSVHPPLSSSTSFTAPESPVPNPDEVAALMKQLQSLPSSQLALHTNVLKNVENSDDDGEEEEDEDEDDAAVNEIVQQAKDEVTMGLGDGDDEDPVVAAALAELNKVEKENKKKKKQQNQEKGLGEENEHESEKGKKKKAGTKNEKGKKDKDCTIQ